MLVRFRRKRQVVGRAVDRRAEEQAGNDFSTPSGCATGSASARSSQAPHWQSQWHTSQGSCSRPVPHKNWACPSRRARGPQRHGPIRLGATRLLLVTSRYLAALRSLSGGRRWQVRVARAESSTPRYPGLCRPGRRRLRRATRPYRSTTSIARATPSANLASAADRCRALVFVRCQQMILPCFHGVTSACDAVSAAAGSRRDHCAVGLRAMALRTDSACRHRPGVGLRHRRRSAAPGRAEVGAIRCSFELRARRRDERGDDAPPVRSARRAPHLRALSRKKSRGAQKFFFERAARAMRAARDRALRASRASTHKVDVREIMRIPGENCDRARFSTITLVFVCLPNSL